MSVRTKLAAFALALAAAFGAGSAIGSVVGPIDVAETPSHSDGPHG